MRNLLRTTGSLLMVGAILIAGGGPSLAEKARWTLTWSDEFDTGAAPDPAKWSHDVGGDGWGNKELEYYTDGTGNSALDGNGNLVITARKERPSGSKCWYGPCRYSSARLVTKDKFDQAYGRFEARMKIPKGQGMWPAFWMMGNNSDTVEWPGCGEIDVMENIGNEPSTVYGTMHGPGYSDDKGPTGSTTTPDGAPLSDAFHTYAVEWTPNSITWFLDDHAYETRTRADIPAGKRWVFDRPFYLLLNLAVGGDWPGDPDSGTAFPQQLTVNYVRVYQAT